MIKKDLLKFIACPDCRSNLTPYDEFLVCVNTLCRRQYTVKNNIPVLIKDMSDILTTETHQQRIIS